jgi:hypothetical protein
VKSPSAEETHVRRILTHRWFKRSAIGAVVLALILVTGAWYFRIHRFRDVLAYYCMSQERHPVWKDLALRRIKPGDDVEEVIERTSPARVWRHDEYVTVDYIAAQGGLCFTQLEIVAKDGGVISAMYVTCTCDHTFFDDLSPNDTVDYRLSFYSYLDKRRNERREAELNEMP